MTTSLQLKRVNEAGGINSRKIVVERFNDNAEAAKRPVTYNGSGVV